MVAPSPVMVAAPFPATSDQGGCKAAMAADPKADPEPVPPLAAPLAEHKGSEVAISEPSGVEVAGQDGAPGVVVAKASSEATLGDKVNADSDAVPDSHALASNNAEAEAAPAADPDYNDAPTTPDISGGGLAPCCDEGASAPEPPVDNQEPAAEPAKPLPVAEPKGEAAVDGEAVKGSEVKAAEALLLAKSDEAAMGGLAAVRTASSKGCSSSDVSPPSTPPAGSTPTEDKVKPGDTSSEEAFSPASGSKPPSPLGHLPAGAHKAQPFVPGVPASPSCGKSDVLSTQSSAALNVNAAEFVPSAPAAEPTPIVVEEYAAHAWYPEGYYRGYDAYGGYTDENGQTYYPTGYYQADMYQQQGPAYGEYAAFDYGQQYGGYDYNAAYGQDQQWTFGSYDAQADPAYWQSLGNDSSQDYPAAPASESSASAAQAEGPAPAGTTTSTAEPQVKAPGTKAAKSMQPGVQGKRTVRGDRQDRPILGEEAERRAYEVAALTVLQQHFNSYRPQLLKELFVVRSKGHLEEALDRLAQMEAEQSGVLPKPGQQKVHAQVKAPPKLDNEADFPSLGSPAKSPPASAKPTATAPLPAPDKPPGVPLPSDADEDSPGEPAESLESSEAQIPTSAPKKPLAAPKVAWAQNRNFADALRKATPAAGEAVAKSEGSATPTAADAEGKQGFKGPSKDSVKAQSGSAPNKQQQAAQTAGHEFSKTRNMYFSKAIAAHRNGHLTLAAELAVKGCACQGQVIKAHALVQEPIFAAKPPPSAARSWLSSKGPRAVPVGRQGARTSSQVVNLHGVAPDEAVERLKKELSILKARASKDAGAKGRLRVVMGPSKQARDTQAANAEPIKEQNQHSRKQYKAVVAFLKAVRHNYEEPSPGLLEVDIN